MGVLLLLQRDEIFFFFVFFSYFYFFFFQAEDGIRDIGVTGVQTCALPISGLGGGKEREPDNAFSLHCTDTTLTSDSKEP